MVIEKYMSIHCRKNTYRELSEKGHNLHREFLETSCESRVTVAYFEA